VPTDVAVDAGASHTFTITTGGTQNKYQWKQNGTAINGATSNAYAIASMTRANSGIYIAEVTNTAVPGLTLKTTNQKATAVANLEGKVQVNATTPVTAGKVILQKINPVGVAFDTIRTLNVKNDGTYKLEKVPLDDYILLAQGDKAAYGNYFPTYYEGSIFWEIADTIRLNNNLPNADITLVSLPTEPKGEGVLKGIFEEELPGGRVENRGRISGASATVRRNQAIGRPAKVMAEEIIRFTYTDEAGAFVFSQLEVGNYLLNIQYPGLPMDPKSDIAFSIGPKSQRQNEQQVDALAIAGQIKVTKRVIVGLIAEQEHVEVYPNPVNGDLYVELGEGNGIGQMKLFDIRGSVLLSKDLTTVKTASDLSQFSPGVYILKIYRNGKEVSVSRVVIE